MNDLGKRLVKAFEGCKLHSYADVVGVQTIGYGHTGQDVYPGQVITQEEADSLLDKDLADTELKASKYITTPLNDNQSSALTSFAFNLGVGNLHNSTLLKKINNCDFNVEDEFKKWCHAGGKVYQGLVDRRHAEWLLFSGQTDALTQLLNEREKG